MVVAMEWESQGAPGWSLSRCAGALGLGKALGDRLLLTRWAHSALGCWEVAEPGGNISPSAPHRYLHLLWEPKRDPGAPSIYRRNVPKLQGTAWAAPAPGK